MDEMIKKINNQDTLLWILHCNLLHRVPHLKKKNHNAAEREELQLMKFSEAAHLIEQDNSGSLTHWSSQDFLVLLHMKCL